MPLIKFENVFFSYPRSSGNSIANVNFSIDSGEYVAVLGLNGSGKSTFARLAAGFFEPSHGKILREDGIIPGIVFQQPKEQIVAGIVERDTAFGPQNLNMTKSEIELRTIECLSVVSMADKALCRTFELSLGQTQRLAFSGILALFPDLIILDEVTAMLDPDSRDQLMQFIGRWNKKNHAVIHITHDLEEALEAGRIIVMEEGRIIFDGTKDAFQNEKTVFEKIFGCGGEYTSFENLNSHRTEESETALKVDGLSFCYDDFSVFRDVSFELKKGSLTALTGPSGCGKSTLFECLAGLKKSCGGRIYAVSRPVLGLQESESALFEAYAADDVAFGPGNKKICGKELFNRVKDSMEAAGLDYNEFGNRPVFSLSGGEKRKLSIAGLIALDSDILIFDEPTAGLDPVSRKNILASFRKLADSGKTVLFTTHRIQEADAADVKLEWNSLISGKYRDSGFKNDRNNLTEMEMLGNASLLDKISGMSSVFMAPASVPPSFVGRLPAAVKAVLFLVIFIASLSVFTVQGCIVMILVSVLYAVLAGYPLSKPAGIIFKILPWVIVFSLLGIFLFPVYEGDTVLFSCGILVITKTKLMLFARAFFHCICAVFALGTYIYSTDERQIMDGISVLLKPLSVLKFPVRYAVLVTGIIFRFMPLLLDELSGIIKTQMIRGAFGNARGIKKIKMIIPVFVPLVLQTFRKAQSLADALTARYFK